MNITNRQSLAELHQLAHKFMDFPVFRTHGAYFAAYFPAGSKKQTAQPTCFVLLQTFTNSGELIWKRCSAGNCYAIYQVSVDAEPEIYDAKTGHRTTFGYVFPPGTPSVVVRKRPGAVAECQFGGYDTY